MATREQALSELYRRGVLNPQQRAAVEELSRRGVLSLPAEAQPEEALQRQVGDIPTQQDIARQDAYRELAEEVGPVQAALIGAGRGFYNIGRGLGLVDPETESEKQAYGALKEHRPYTTGAGEIVGEAAPFVAAGGVAGFGARTLLPKAGEIGARALAAGETLAGRTATGAAMGGLEGGVVAAGRGENVEEGILTGATFGAIAEPVLRMARGVYRRVRGVEPEGALIDGAGMPTPELQQALARENLTFEDLTEQATDLVSQQQAGAVPGQVARAAKFQESGVRATRGDITQAFSDQATESRLLQSARDPLADPFRQYKLSQSQDIDRVLSENVRADILPEETGLLIKDALTGRKNLLKTEKNDLYNQFARATENLSSMPIFTDAMADAVPSAREMRDLQITAPEHVKTFDNLLMSYGIKEPTEDFLKLNVEPEILSAENFERFRKSINVLERRDQTGAIKVATGPLKRALDSEVDDMADVLSAEGFGREITEPIKQARKRVRTLKTEFSPQAAVGKLVDTAKDGVTNVIEASKVYSNNIVSRSVPVENVRKIIGSLNRAGEEGKAAVGSLQMSTMMDIINAGFGTKSRKIEGVRLFNPIAYKNRLDAIGKPKLKAIFSDNPAMLKRLENVDEISEYLIKSAEAEPKGSSSTILDLMDKLQVSAISSKIPLVGPAFNEFLQSVLQGQRTRSEVNRALNASPEMQEMADWLHKSLPGVASSLGIPAFYEAREQAGAEPQPAY